MTKQTTAEEQERASKQLFGLAKMQMISQNYKFLKVAHLRDLENQVSSGEITYSKMVEVINEMAYDFYKPLLDNKLQEYRDLLQTELLEDDGDPWYNGLRWAIKQLKEDQHEDPRN